MSVVANTVTPREECAVNGTWGAGGISLATWDHVLEYVRLGRMKQEGESRLFLTSEWSVYYTHCAVHT